MWMWIVGGLGLPLTAVTALLIRHRRHRTQTLRQLAAQRAEWANRYPVSISCQADRELLSRRFQQDRLVRVDDFLSSVNLKLLREEAESNMPRMVASYIPTHKKGKTLSYENIHRYAHACLGLYHSAEMQQFVSDVTGEIVVPTPDQDQSSLSVLCYNEAGDHINWHYDHNFYRGRHFTVLLSLANESATGGVSHSQLMQRTSNGDLCVDTSPNTLVIFEGARVLHRASPTEDGDFRVMLSMTYCADPRTRWFKELARRIKDTAFFGLRALWD